MPLDPIALVLSQRGILPAQVHIRNLTSTTTAGIDGWGRSKKLQPLQISVSVGLNAPFTTSSDTDSVDSSTVHYGFLAKAILASLEGYSGTTNDSTDDPTTLASMLVRVWSHLTGLSVDGRERNLPEDDRPFLDVTSLRSLTVTLTLPKASLLGSGVSIMATALFGLPSVAPGLVSTFAIQLAVRGIRVPTLVGVNSNERQAKQIVIADVEVDRFDTEGDIYADLEAEIAKAIEESSYETLEALATHLGEHVLAFVPPGENATGRDLGWQVKISLEKPIAIPLADGPVVEVVVN